MWQLAWGSPRCSRSVFAMRVEPRKIEVLKTELSIEPIRADSVTFLQIENRILHLY